MCDEEMMEEDGTEIELIPDMNLGINTDVLEEIFSAKKGDPNKFQSFWEMDEEDVNEASLEEIQKDPAKKILWAAENNLIEVIKELLSENRSLVSSRDDDGYTPLHRAAYNGHTDTILLLLENGADIHAQTLDGWHPLHSAARWNQADVVALLLQYKANVNAQTNSGQTALHIASSDKECRECLEVLLMDRNVDINLSNNLGETAYDICQRTSDNCILFEMHTPSLKRLRENS